MNRQALDAILDKLDVRSNRHSNHERRDSKRLRFRTTDITVNVSQARGHETQLRVIGRDINQIAIRFLSTRYLYPDSACEITLPMLNGGYETIRGCVLRCSNVTGALHDVSVKFDAPLAVRQFVDVDAHISVLLTEASDEMRTLLSGQLAKNGISISVCPTAEDMQKLVKPGVFDLILLDLTLPGMDGFDALSNLRESGILTPVILITAQETEQIRARARELGFAAILTKPLYRQMLVDSVVNLAAKNAPIVSRFANNPKLSGLLDSFREGIGRKVSEIKSHVDKGEFFAAERMLSEIVSVAGGTAGLGYDVIADSAEKVRQLIVKSVKDGALKSALIELQRLTARVR
jgi:CheY-like chemotaxis protein